MYMVCIIFGVWLGFILIFGLLDKLFNIQKEG